jgi:hypothetical protein
MTYLRNILYLSSYSIVFTAKNTYPLAMQIIIPVIKEQIRCMLFTDILVNFEMSAEV